MLGLYYEEDKFANLIHVIETRDFNNKWWMHTFQNRLDSVDFEASRAVRSGKRSRKYDKALIEFWDYFDSVVIVHQPFEEGEHAYHQLMLRLKIYENAKSPMGLACFH